MQQEQNNRYLYLLLTFELFQIKIIPSPLKHFQRTRSNDARRLIEFTPCEKQKYQVTFVTKNKNITSSHTVSNLKAHLRAMTSWVCPVIVGSADNFDVIEGVSF